MQRSRCFVPWLHDDPIVPIAIAQLEPGIAERLRPRLRASAQVLTPLRRAMPNATFYVEVGELVLDQPITDAVPIVSIDRSFRSIRDIVSRAVNRLAISVPVHHFESGDALAERLVDVALLLPDGMRVDLFVDVVVRDSVQVAEAVAAGAARRVPSVIDWNDVVINFFCACDRSTRPRERRRPQYKRWTRDVPRSVVAGESIDVPREAYVYPLIDRWIVADATSPSSGRLLAELIAGNSEFSDECCAGDRWIASASAGRVDTADVASWRRAALLHWLTTCVTASDEAPPL